MAVRGWGGSIATAVGVAAGAGAAQLGLGYGLGIIAWLPASNGASEAAWVASLAWATWIAATSTVAGAIVADRLGPLSPERSTPDGDPAAASPLAAGLWRVALAVAAAVGALVTVALVAVPARAAQRADTFSPQTIAAGYAIIGVIAGLLVAIAALASRAVATNVIATVGFLWLLAVIAVVDGVAAGRGLGTAQLGVWQFTSESDGYWFGNLYLPGMGLSVLSALAIGGLAAWPAAKRADNRVGMAVSGAIGPLLVAAAYFLAAPNLVGVRNQQLSAYLVAPYALIAGLAGSVLVAALAARDQAAGALTPAPAEGPATLPGQGSPVSPAPAGAAARGKGADDEHAPAAAYATDSRGSGQPPGRPSAQPAAARASVPAPAWPADTATKPAKPTKPAKRAKPGTTPPAAPKSTDPGTQ